MISTMLPVLTFFSSSQKEAGFSLLLPPSTHTRLLLPAVSTVINGISQSEVTGAGDFPVGVEDGGAECKVLGLCLLRLHPRSTLQGFPHRVQGLQCHCHQCAGLEKRQKAAVLELAGISSQQALRNPHLVHHPHYIR